MSTPGGWDTISQLLAGMGVTLGVALLIAGVFLLAISGGAAQWMSAPFLRFWEGYWPRLLWKLRQRFTGSLNRKIAAWETEWGQLADGLEQNSLDSQQYERYIRLDAELEDFPLDLNQRLPTRVGNTLRAAEEYPGRCYRLEVSTTWPRLWLSLPESTQKEQTEARQALNWSAQLMLWGLLSILWVFLARWAFIPGLVVAVAGYQRMRSTADAYGQLLRSAYDLHRFALYEGLRWPPPSDPLIEKEIGVALTLYLKRNIPPVKLPPNNAKLFFKHPKDE